MKWFLKSLLTGGLVLSVNCGGPNEAEAPKGNQMPNKPIQQVQEEHTDHMMSLPGVVGTGIGESQGKPCIKVFVSQKTAEIEKGVPKSLEGYPVVIEETGEFKALEGDS